MNLAERAVKRAHELGATEAEAYVERTRMVRVEFAEQIDNFRTTESLGIGLRVALGKKIAMYSTSILNEAEIDKAVAKAVKIARVAPEDPNWKRMNKKFGSAPAQGYYDKAVETLETSEIVENLTSAINQMKSIDKRVKPTAGSLTTSISNASIVNSHNQSSDRKETSVSVSIHAAAEEADLKSTGNMHQEARFWKEINLEDQAAKTVEKAVKFLNAKAIPSCKTSVIIENSIFANIMGFMLNTSINANYVQKGMSPLANKLGTQIALEDITITDNGLMDRGWQTRPFDDEGHPTQKTPIIERGTLRNYLYDTYTALKDNVDSTGNARRLNYSMAPEAALSNLILEPGKVSPEEMVRETKNGVYVEDTIGEWLSDPVSGSLSATVTHGYLIENGKLTQPIKGVIISGNFYEILKNDIEILGNDLKNNMQCYSPTVKLAQLTIAGKE